MPLTVVRCYCDHLFFQQKILKAQRRVPKINSRITASLMKALAEQNHQNPVREAENLQNSRRKPSHVSLVGAGRSLASLYLPSVLTLRHRGG